jgi:hypothetical protein
MYNLLMKRRVPVASLNYFSSSDDDALLSSFPSLSDSSLSLSLLSTLDSFRDSTKHIKQISHHIHTIRSMIHLYTYRGLHIP